MHVLMQCEFLIINSVFKKCWCLFHISIKSDLWSISSVSQSLHDLCKSKIPKPKYPQGRDVFIATITTVLIKLSEVVSTVPHRETTSWNMYINAQGVSVKVTESTWFKTNLHYLFFVKSAHCLQVFTFFLWLSSLLFYFLFVQGFLQK